MSQFQQLDQLMERQDGMLRTGQALAAGISKPVFYQFVQSRGLEQAAHGIYLSKDAWVDAMYLLHLRCPQAVFSHETALFFHDLTDREPLAYSITVKTGYNPTRLKVRAFGSLPSRRSCMRSACQPHRPPSATMCRSMIWNGRSAMCCAAGATSRCRHFRTL